MMNHLVTIHHFLHTATQKLTLVTDSPQLEAEALLAHVLKKNRSYLLAFAEKELAAEEVAQAAADIHRRYLGEPLAYIVGHKEFWSREFQVTPATLIPRPETELLVEITLKLLHQKEAKIADLGTGSGAVGVSLACERPAWRIDATDISPEALAVARKNAQQFKLKNVFFYQGNWCTALTCTDFDAIISNPPYIAEEEWDAYEPQLIYEPRKALIAGKDGLSAINDIAQSAKFFLKDGGYLLVEHGFLQGEKVRALFMQEGYTEVHSICDLSGHERVTLGRRIAFYL